MISEPHCFARGGREKEAYRPSPFLPPPLRCYRQVDTCAMQNDHTIMKLICSKQDWCQDFFINYIHWLVFVISLLLQFLSQVVDIDFVLGTGITTFDSESCKEMTPGSNRQCPVSATRRPSSRTACVVPSVGQRPCVQPFISRRFAISLADLKEAFMNLD